MKKLVFALTCVFGAAMAASAAVPFKLGIAGYTYYKYSLEQTLAAMQKMDIKYLCIKDFHVAPNNAAANYAATDEQIATLKDKLAKAGIIADGIGPQYFKDEKTARQAFEFAKKMGLKVVTVVPYEVPEGQKDVWGKGRQESEAMLDVLEKLVKEYDMCAAIHNHGPDIPNLYPTAEAVWARIKNRDPRIGFCLDVGHQRRAGNDPVEAIKRYAGRIYDVHMKNIKIDPVKNFAEPGPRGELDIPAIMQALADIGYTGTCHIEYEKDFDNNDLPMAESIGYYRGCMDSVHMKAKMAPVPEGANTLSDTEKTEGWQLLFNGKDLPSDNWVGVKTGCKEFPKQGWYVKDGALSMRPINGISPEGKWFPLPPEDQKLGGGGDIVTIKKYRDFMFKFDFRLTEAANSGIKYFFDENLNKGTTEEYQVLDAAHPDSTKGVDGNRRVAALYDIFPAHAEKYVKPLGQWNTGMIVAKGNTVEHWLNGEKVLTYTRGTPEFKAAVKASKYASWGVDKDGKPQDWGEIPEGRLLIQDHSDSTASFCNLKVKEL